MPYRPGSGESPGGDSDREGASHVDARQARDLHESRLLQLANVTGVSTGRDEYTGEDVIVVFVTRIVSRDGLRSTDVVPGELEGVPVRVVAIGDVEAQDDSEEF
ncbi:hypothetical protein GCM10010329_10050 [Streptomyces spiroverticillatus]|uniref:Uncharacterized protein n=1 Tax=Streptomyces finlayi TaxID=67296 RepID=A0A918WXQ8_9ACTN|nr:hypothetical protein GCM10010329_10050 [Streptomyces spiroverticillatus]GHC93683.1 hypothetical protein GCM10010334_31040 [Streptomyces finlayi]